MTLIEIMIASGLSVVVSMGIAGIYIFAIQQFTILVNMNTAQENVLWMAYHTKNMMGQAVNIGDPAPANPGLLTGCSVPASLGSVTGCIPTFTTATSATANNTTAIAAFQREWSVGFDAGGAQSELLPTAIFFRRPTADIDGRIYFDLYTTPGSAMSAGEDDIVYGQVVRYDMVPNVESIYGFLQVTGVDVNIATRYHRSSSENKKWCVPGDVAAACTSGVAASDVSMRFSVGLRNNRALEKTPGVNGQSRSIHGGIYYYRFIPPLFTDVQ